MSGRTIAAVLLVIVLGIGATALGVTAYNAGVTAGLAQNVAATGGSVVVAPGYGAPYVGWGYGWGGGFGFLGFFGFLIFFLIVFGLIRAAFGMGRGWGRRGYYGPGGPGGGWDHRHGYDAWNDRIREVHDELHRTGDQPSSGQSASGDASPPRS